METILYVLHVLVCLAMLPIILLQAGKGGGVSAGFGGGSQSVFGGSSGASTFLLKLTSGAAVLFMITSLGLSYYSSKSKSVIGDVPAQETSADKKGPSSVTESAPQGEAPSEGAPTSTTP